MLAAPKTIDCTPTWSGILPVLIALLQNSRTRKDGTIELERMAKLADKYVQAQKQMPEPPLIIKITEDFTAGLDLRNPVEAAAYLKAASHFLSGWPQDWSAERLCLALLDEESADQPHVQCWEGVTRDLHPADDPYLFVEELINSLAEDFLVFAKQISR